MWLAAGLLVLAAYLVGSVPCGYLVAKAKAGIDIRRYGSGNIGATNVGRTLGLRFFFLVFILDFLKGVLPVAAALALVPSLVHMDGSPSVQTALAPLVGLSAILGHMFPVYLTFKGGKGVATSIGVVLLLTPIAAIVGLVGWTVVVVATRLVSAASIIFAVIFLVTYFLTTRQAFDVSALGYTVFVLLTAILIVVRHHTNIVRIFNGTEARIRMPWQRSE
jgi:glycerol-3-phosphate acyltransferase PlsY